MEAVQADCTGRQLRGSTRLLQGARQAVDRGCDIAEQRGASLGQRHAAGGAMEQPDAQPLLQAADQLAQRRGRYPQLLGRSAETPLLGYGCKGAQGTELARMDHGVHLSIVKLAL